jgi:AraC-like DNA-binding protein
MRIPDENLYINIFPLFVYVANRKCSINWKLKGPSIFNRHNLVLVYKGKAEITCNKQTFMVGPGNLIYFKPGDYRKGHTFGSNLMQCYTVEFYYTLPTFSNNRWELHSPALPFLPVEQIEDQFLFSRLLELFSRFTKTFISSYNNKTSRGRALFMEILYLLTQWKTENYIYDNIQKVEQVINYMMEYYTQPIKLKELADVISVSPSYIGSIFKSVTGKSPITYLIEIRLHKAKELLLDGHSVSDVAEEVGFNDLFYFSKCFKKFENLSPLQFKQIANNSSDTYIDSKF